MARRSAGLLLHRGEGPGTEVLLVHPGGPYFRRRDAGAWSIPKGEHLEGEDALATAEREFAEELGQPAPPGERCDLGEVRQAGGKLVHAFAVAGDLDPSTLRSNLAEVEWPPRSGRRVAFPEVDRVEWCSLGLAREKLLPAQVAFLDRLVRLLGVEGPPG